MWKLSGGGQKEKENEKAKAETVTEDEDEDEDEGQQKAKRISSAGAKAILAMFFLFYWFLHAVRRQSMRYGIPVLMSTVVRAMIITFKN